MLALRPQDGVALLDLDLLVPIGLFFVDAARHFIFCQPTRLKINTLSARQSFKPILNLTQPQ